MATRGPLNQRVGKNLRALRVSRGISQEALAHELEYDRTYLAGIERGERNLSLDTLSKLAEQLGVDPVELLAN
jgi:transcriptional regulator with XRE-family HTH domain